MPFMPRIMFMTITRVKCKSGTILSPGAINTCLKAIYSQDFGAIKPELLKTYTAPAATVARPGSFQKTR